MHATKDYCKYEKDGMAKANFHATKKAGKKLNPVKQLFAQLSKKLDHLEKTIKKAPHKSKKRRRDDSGSNSEQGIGLGSTRDIGLNLDKTVKWYKFTPPSPNKATPSESTSDSNIVSNQQIASNQDIASPATLSKPAILRDSAKISDRATFSEPAILRDSATLSYPAMPSNPATYSNPLTFSNADDVTVMS